MGDKKIYLVVEDDPVTARLFERFSTLWGYESIVATEGTAEQLNATNMPAVVQLDGLDGRCFDLHDKLIRSNPHACYILVSSNGMYSDLAEQRGIHYFYKSPQLNYNEIREFIESQTRQHAETTEPDEIKI